MHRFLRRLDDGVARGEAALAAIVLLAMIAAAATQAILRNLTDAHVQWANDALGVFDWIDPFLKKGTIWIAFLGASLATHHDKHIGIDVLSRIAPAKIRRGMRAVVGIAAGITSFFLAMVFWVAVLNNATTGNPDYEVMDATRSVHVCDASDELLQSTQVWREGCEGSPEECMAPMERPAIFCGLRSFLGAVGAQLHTTDPGTGEPVIKRVSTPEGASLLIMPAMFLLIAVRFTIKGIGTALGMTGHEEEPPGDPDAEPPEDTPPAGTPEEPKDPPGRSKASARSARASRKQARDPGPGRGGRGKGQGAAPRRGGKGKRSGRGRGRRGR